MSQNRRKRILVSDVQKRLLRRNLFHWSVILLVTFFLGLVGQLLVGGPTLTWSEHLAQLWARQAPFAVILLLLLPVIAFDAVHQTNRFAGPVNRLKQQLHRLAEGKQVDPLSFRQGDYWTELAEDFNAVLRRFEVLESKLERANRSGPATGTATGNGTAAATQTAAPAKNGAANGQPAGEAEQLELQTVAGP